MQERVISSHTKPFEGKTNTLLERIDLNTSDKKPTATWKGGLQEQTIRGLHESIGDEVTANSRPAMSDETNSAHCDVESTLTQKIERLWSIEHDKNFALKRTRHERANNRAELAKELSELKSLLCGRGREGAWLPFLRWLHIPRSTAEGLIKSHLIVDAKDKTPRVPPVMTKDSIEKLLKALKPKLRPLNTRELADHFVRELVAILDEQIAQRNEFGSGAGQGQDEVQENSVQQRNHEQMISIEAISD